MEKREEDVGLEQHKLRKEEEDEEKEDFLQKDLFFVPPFHQSNGAFLLLTKNT